MATYSASTSHKSTSSQRNTASAMQIAGAIGALIPALPRLPVAPADPPDGRRDHHPTRPSPTPPVVPLATDQARPAHRHRTGEQISMTAANLGHPARQAAILATYGRIQRGRAAPRLQQQSRLSVCGGDWPGRSTGIRSRYGRRRRGWRPWPLCRPGHGIRCGVGAARKRPRAMGWNRSRLPAVYRRVSRWAAAAAVAAVIVAGCGSAPGSPSRSASQGSGHPRAPTPSADEAAFAGRGELAVVSRGSLWVLDGATGTLRRVPTPGMTPLDPAFSWDGRWLAFLGSSASPSAQAYTVWLASGDGSGAHQIVAGGGLIGWSPVSDVLAVTTGNTIQLVRPSGSARTLVRAPGIGSAVWSPDGSSMAVAVTSSSASALASYPVAGGRPTAWLRLTARGRANYIIDAAGQVATSGDRPVGARRLRVLQR